MAYVTPFFLVPARSVLLGMMHPETDPIFSSYILGTAADWQDLVWRTHIHEKLIPIAVLSVVHAVRISHGTRMLSGGIHGRRSLEGTFLGGCLFTWRRAAPGVVTGG